jgi:DNA-binding SARP family transcriptional activator
MLRIRMLGHFEIKDGDRTLEHVDRRGQELLAYLLLNRNHPQTREAVAVRLWPDLPPHLTRKYVRQGIWSVNAGIRAAAKTNGRTPNSDTTDTGGPGVVVTDGNLLRPADGVWLDLAEFEDAHDAVMGRAGTALDRDAADALHRAVGLYAGDLLEGWSVEWCDDERRATQAKAIAMLDKLVAYHAARGATEGAVAAALRILAIDPARERTHRHVMRLRYEAGDRTGALRQYQACVDALDRELGVRPSRRTSDLFRQIKLDRLKDAVPVLAGSSRTMSHPTTGSLPGQRSAAPTSKLGGVLDALRELHDALDGLGRRVEREIDSVETALRRRDDED